LCSLGCVNKELSACVRQFWAEGEASSPGGQASLLRVDDQGPGVAAATYRFDWQAHRPRMQFEVKLVTGETELCQYASLQMRAGQADCSSCGQDRGSHPYIFDGRRGLGSDFALCRSCFKSAERSGSPPHSRAARFRLAPCNKLIDLYLTPLPRSIVTDAVARQRALAPKSPFIFEHTEPHACVRRVAAFALARHTPRELHEHWRDKGLDGWA
jgi:hypothetical protein